MTDRERIIQRLIDDGYDPDEVDTTRGALYGLRIALEDLGVGLFEALWTPIGFAFGVTGVGLAVWWIVDLAAK